MTKTGHDTLVIDELNTIDAGDGWRSLGKIETTGSVEIRVNNLLVGPISSGGSIRSGGSIFSGRSISAGGTIRSGGSISACGSISSGGPLSAGAWVSAGGSIRSDRSISADAWVSAGGSIRSDAWISAEGSISADRSISADAWISSGGPISAEGTILCRVLYWGLIALPECTEIVVTHAVRPPEWQREHWANRLGVEIPKYDCYDEIERLYASRLPEWLARTDLLPVERLILESHTPEARAKAAARAEELRGAIKREGNK